MYASIATHIIEPAIFLLGFGIGVGMLIQEVDGVSYLEFIAAGMVGYGIMNSCSFEALFSAFSRMHIQKTWDAMLNAPMTIDDVLLGEWLWATIKGMMSGCAMLLVLCIMGIPSFPHTLLALPCMVISGLAFSGIALPVIALAKNYDFFSYYFSLFITPMMLLSGAFSPVDRLPEQLLMVTKTLPLYHAVSLFRPLIGGHIPENLYLHLAVLLAYGLVGIYVALVLLRHRILR
jgi:lipooligosaccharide transport system permease protein